MAGGLGGMVQVDGRWVRRHNTDRRDVGKKALYRQTAGGLEGIVQTDGRWVRRHGTGRRQVGRQLRRFHQHSTCNVEYPHS